VSANRRLARFTVALATVLLFPPAGMASPGAGASCSAKSGIRTLALLELYTSEGCDNCPPADRWLSANFPPGVPRADAIPLAFHVDYWDRPGWKDRFATPAWTARQYAAARAGRSDLVYTPQVLVQGRNLRDWRVPEAVRASIAVAGGRPPRADVALAVALRNRSVTVNAAARVPGVDDRQRATLFVALADSGLVSEVEAGENTGARLARDHVVRALTGGSRPDVGGDIAGEFVFPLPSEAGTATTVVAFVQDTRSGEVLQAVEVPLACIPAH
jgi:hypothetical protein